MTYSYSMFIDDERYPTTDRNWYVARSSAEACSMITKLGMPEHIGFDHDLGGQDTAMIFLRWLVDHALDKGLEFNFTYDVHSQNPVGARNIAELIEGFKDRDRPKETP